MLCLVRQLALLSTLALAMVPFAAAQTDARRVGTWDVLQVLDAQGEDAPGSDEMATMTFTADGRLLVRLYGTPNAPIDETIKTSYRVEGDVIVAVAEDGKSRPLSYRVEGDTLLLSPDFGTEEVATLRRVVNTPDQ